MVKKWHVEFDIESDDPLSGWQSSYAKNLVTTEIAPKIEPGWYRVKRNPSVVYHYAASDLGVVESDFLETHQRMHPPVPWVDTSDVGEDSKYTDGYYRTEDGDQYRRIDGVWTFRCHDNGPWYTSCHTDADIEDPADGVVFVPEA